MVLYPSFAALFVFGAAVFLLIYLVPQLAVLFKNFGQTLPLQTRALIAVSDFARDYWYTSSRAPVLIGPAGGRRRALFPNFAFAIDRQARDSLHRADPHKIILTRFTNTFAMMYAAGITVLDAIKVSEEVAGNRRWPTRSRAPTG